MRVDAACEGARVVFPAVEELEVLAEEVGKDVLAELVVELLGGSVSSLDREETESSGGASHLCYDIGRMSHDPICN